MMRRRAGIGMSLFLAAVLGILVLAAVAGAAHFWLEIAFRSRWAALAIGLCFGIAAATLGFFITFRSALHERYERSFHAAVNDLPLLFCRFLPDGTLTYVNEAYCRCFDRTRNDLTGENFFGLLPEEVRESVRRHYLSLTAESPSKTYEHRVFSTDGSVRWQRWTDRAVIEDGRIVEYNSFGEDITDQRQSEAALRQSEDKFARAFRLNASMLIIVEEGTRLVLEANESFYRITGYRPDEVIGKTVDVFDTLFDPDLRRRIWREVQARGRAAEQEIRYFCRSGEERVALCSVERLNTKDHPAVLITANDVTALKRARQDLLESERRLGALMDNLPGIAYRCRNDEFWTFEYANEGALPLTGYTPAELIGNRVISYSGLIHPDDRGMVREKIDTAVREYRKYVLEYRIVTRAGEVKWVWEQGGAVYGEDGVVRSLEGFVTDITGWKDAVEAVRVSEEKYRTLFEGMDNAIANHRIITGEDGVPVDYVFLEVNEAFLRYAGMPREALVGKRMTEVYPVLRGDAFDWVSTYGRVALTGEPVRFEQYSPAFDRWISVSVHSPAPGEFVTNFYDISARKKAEAERERYASLLRATLESTEDGIMVSSLGKGISIYNQRLADLWRLPPEILDAGDDAIMSASKREMLDPEAFVETQNAYLDDPEREGIDTLLFRDGRVFEQYTRPQRLGDEVVGRVWSFRDVTPKIIAEQSLRESELKYRTLFESMNDGSAEHLLVIDEQEKPVDFIYLDMNREFERLVGINKDDVVGKGHFEYYGERAREEDPRWLETYARVALSGNPERFEMYSRLVGKWFAVSAYCPAEGRFVSTITDITDRKRAEDALRENEKLLSTVLDSLPVAVWIIDRDAKTIRGNPVGQRMWGGDRDVRPGDIIPKGWRMDTGEPVRREEWASWRAVKKGEVSLDEEIEIECLDGTRKVILVSGIPLRNEAGEIIGGITVNEDITERKRAEDALRDEKERLAVTLRSIGDGVITTDRDGRVSLMNRVAEELTGWRQAEAAGLPLEDVFAIFDEETRERVESPYRKIIATGGIVEMSSHTMLLSRDGREILLADSGAPILDQYSRIIGAVLVFRDVTERKRIEDELQKMDKLESVGVLAGGIAHDFNNILTGLLGSLSLAGALIDGNPEVFELIREAERQSLRARDLTGQLLTFSKGGMPIRITASIVETVRENTKFMLRGSRVRAVFSLPDDLWAARVDLGQLTQVINNLVINAIQAMPDGGRIEIGARNIAAGTQKMLPLAPGEYIELTIRDHGSGIPRENLARVFDPYFTTKQKGSGLGLATTYSIVKRHDGHIEVESEMGKGTTFRIYLPAVPGQSSSKKPAEPSVAIRNLGGEGRVLVMDDDEGVRGMASLLLQTLGYTVETAHNGEQALDRYRAAKEAGETFDVVIMDLTIPDGMGGKETIAALKEYDPEVCAIVSSGYSTDPIMAEYREYGFHGVLMKPYRLGDVSRILHEAIKRK